MRGFVLYVLASLFALVASLAWRLGDPSPWQSLGPTAQAMVVRSDAVRGTDGRLQPEVVVGFEHEGLRREAAMEGLALDGPAANCTASPTGAIAEWPAGTIVRVRLPDGPMGPVRRADASASSWFAAIVATLLAATAVVAGLVWSLRHDLRLAPSAPIDGAHDEPAIPGAPLPASDPPSQTTN